MPTTSTHQSITPLTTAVLRWIGEGGLASQSQLARRFWPDGGPDAAPRALRRLSRAGYLLRRSWRAPDTPLFVLAPLCVSALHARPPIIQIGWPSRGECDHLLLAQEARQLLEQQLAASGGRIVAWRRERWLRHLSTPPRGPGRRVPAAQDIPDAQVEWQRTATAPVETVDIEIDGAYYGHMLAQKAARYGATERPVLWVCTPKRAALVARAVAPYTNIRLFMLPAHA